MRLNRLTRDIEADLLAGNGGSLHQYDLTAGLDLEPDAAGNALVLLRIRPQFIDQGDGFWSLNPSAIFPRGES